MAIDDKIRLLHIASGDLWAGAEMQLYSLLESLRENKRFEISALLLNDGKLAANLRNSGIEPHIIPESEYGFRRIVTAAASYAEKKKFDIVHSHRYKENILAAILKRRGLAKCLVQTVHGAGEPFTGLALLKSRIFSTLNDYYTRKYFDRIVTVSEDLRRRLSKKFPSAKLLTFHNAIDPAKLAIRRSTQEIRTELGIRDDHILIGSAGRMVPVKGYDRFIMMAKIIRDKSPKTSFILAGEGPQREALMKMAAEQGLGGAIVFTGFRDDVYDIINSLDIFVISSLHEGIPMVLLEAMAFGKPVVATAVGGIGEVIEDGVSGMLVPTDDPSALAESCLRLIADSKLRQSLSQQSRLRIEREFSINTLRRRMVELYENLYRPRPSV